MRINPAAMLKPPAPVAVASYMRHLSVPSKETAFWREKLASQGWLAEGCGIHQLNEMRAIPLSSDAPSLIENFEIVELEALTLRSKHWIEQLPRELYIQYKDEWPMSHDRIGDIIILKIPEMIEQYSEIIGQAILSQHSSVRLVCADFGVKGEFRVRKLKPIISRDGDLSTRTSVSEHGNQFIVDPRVVYYSPRLATERRGNLTTAINLKQLLGRPLVVCDPYAGAGPGLISLLGEPDLISKIIASDINPKAVELLHLNLPENAWIDCCDARSLHLQHSQTVDFLLVNLPHDSIVHLPDLLPLMAKGHPVIIRGWAMISLDKLGEIELQIREIFGGVEIHSLEIIPTRSYSATESYSRIETQITIQ